MSLETIVNDLVLATDALHDAITDKRTVLDAAAQAAAASLTTTQGLQTQAAASAATAAAKATEATNNATQIAAYKTAAAALDTSTTATAAVTNLLPDMLAKKDPARHPFRKKMPTLVLDFERQKCHRYAPGSGFGETALSSFMTFTRASTATYVGPDGLLKTAAANEPRYGYDPLTGECKGLLVEEQRTNLLTYSSNLEKKPLTWCRALPFATKSPDGYLLGAKLIADTTNAQHRVEQSSTVVIGTQYTASVFAKAGELSQIQLRTANDLVSFVFDLSSGTATNQGSVGTGGITSVGNGWYLCWCCYAPTLTTAYTRVNLLQGGSNIFTGDNMSGVYLFGLQLEAGTFPTSYIPTPATFTGRPSTATYLDSNGVLQTADSGVARSNAYDYDSDGVLRPIGLLLEASATNQLLYSEQFDNAVWGKTGSSVTANAVVAPDGLTTADAFLDDATNVYHRVSQSLSVTAGSTYTYSTYVKAGAVQYLVLNGGALIGAVATFDLTAGTVSLVISGSASLQKLANGWFRCSVTGVAPTTQTSQCFIGFNTSNVDGAYIGSGQVCGYLWGAQLGVGSYPTSYIATTSAQVTRAADASTSAQATRVADDAKVDGANFSNFYNQTGGTLRIKMNSVGTDSSHGFGVWAYGANLTSLVGISNNSSSEASALTTGFVLQARNSTALTSNQNAAVSYKKDAFTAAFNGVCGTQNTSCLVPEAALLRIGTNGVSSQRSCGTISRISYYPQPFTNEELQAATSA